MNKKKIISYIVDGILISIIVFLLYVSLSMTITRNQKQNHGVPSAFGKSFLYVATESMDDPDNPKSLKAGTGIIITKVKNLDSLKVSEKFYNEKLGRDDYDKTGDIVTFYLTTLGAPDTHRLVGKEYDPSTGKYTFTTMGDNPSAHSLNKTETWSEDLLIGKVVYSSKGLGTFLSIASPEAAASAGKKAWFFPVAIITPIVLLAGYYIIDAIVKYRKEEKEREARIEAAMIEAGIDMNDEVAKELFRAKEEIRMEYYEEKERIKKKIRKELEKQNKQ